MTRVQTTPPSTVDEGYAFFESLLNSERRPDIRTYRLERMELLVKRLGNPQDGFRSIHVAGTKGKGSTSAYLAEIVAEFRGRCGLYCSPHVNSYQERIRLIGVPDAEGPVLRAMRQLHSEILLMEAEGDPVPTTFEALTACAFVAFVEAGLDWAVLEVGLGGRLDATNVVVPEVGVITAIGMDHMEFLGPTIGHIAAEKAGIAKPGAPLVVMPNDAEVESIIHQTASSRGATVIQLQARDLPAVTVGPEGTYLLLPGTDDDPASDSVNAEGSLGVQLRMNGAVQAKNVGVALAALRCTELGPEMLAEPRRVAGALARAWQPGRFELVRISGRTLVMDGAHTAESVATTRDTLAAMGISPECAVFGTSTGRDPVPLVRALGPLPRFIFTRAGDFRPQSPAAMAALPGMPEAPTILVVQDPAEALEEALRLVPDGAAVLVVGSLHLVGAVRRALGTGGEDLALDRYRRPLGYALPAGLLALGRGGSDAAEPPGD